MKHVLLNLISIFLLKAVVFAKTADEFSYESPFKASENSFAKDAFAIDDVKNHVQADNVTQSVQSIINQLKNESNQSNYASVADTNNSLWYNTTSGRKINTDVLDSETFYDIFIANQCIYQTTRRYKEDKLLFPKNQKIDNIDDDCSPYFKELKRRGIKIAGYISGIQGAANIKESGIIGIVAYKEVVKNNKKEIRVFVIEECSQAEVFQFLGGIGGASWMTNFDAKKVSVNPQALAIPKRYLSKNIPTLSFHEGFYNKILSSKVSTENCLKAFFSKLGVKDFETIKYDLNLDETITGLTLKEQVDAYNKCTIKLYTFGYSQGGGLIQILAPYLTCWTGEYLYGKSFDNKVFNMSHAICFSPARAIGNATTLEVVENVMGNQNILGYCSYADAVPCLPLGKNIGKDPIKEHGMKLLQTIGKAISLVLQDPYKSLLKTLCGAENFYETLNVWAYEDPFYLIGRYCELSTKNINDYINCLNDNTILPMAYLQNPKLNVANYKKTETSNANKILKRLQKAKKNINKVKKHFNKMQDYYFKAHTSNVIVSNVNAGVAVVHLKKMLNYINIEDFLIPQHFATYYFLKFKADGKTYVTPLDLGFNEDLLKRDLQAAIDLGVQYHKNKAEKIKGK